MVLLNGPTKGLRNVTLACVTSCCLQAIKGAVQVLLNAYNADPCGRHLCAIDQLDQQLVRHQQITSVALFLSLSRHCLIFGASAM